MPTMAAVRQALSPSSPMLVNSRYIITGTATPPIKNPVRSVRRTSRRT